MHIKIALEDKWLCSFTAWIDLCFHQKSSCFVDFTICFTVRHYILQLIKGFLRIQVVVLGSCINRSLFSLKKFAFSKVHRTFHRAFYKWLRHCIGCFTSDQGILQRIINGEKGLEALRDALTSKQQQLFIHMAIESLQILPKQKVFSKEWICQAPNYFRLKTHITSSFV